MNERKADSKPVLIACKPLSEDHIEFKKVVITSDEFTIGRGLHNSTVIAYAPISRNHCKFKKNDNNEWLLEDYSAFGIEVNGSLIGKGNQAMLTHGDRIKMEPSEEFVYRFIFPSGDEYDEPRKRMKIDDDSFNTDFINNVKNKFEQSQDYERSHIQQKMVSAKQMITKSMELKWQLQLRMDRKLRELDDYYCKQIKNLNGEKDEVEKQTALLNKEKDTQFIAIQEEMGGKIAGLMEQIKKHVENEEQLSKENSLLKEKLEKERETFLAELLKESSSKQDMLDQLEKKIQDQENIRKKEIEELENMHKKENEQLRLTMEKEFKELEEQKKLREKELKDQLDIIKKKLIKQVEQTEQQRLIAEQELNEKLKEMQQISDVEKVKVEQLEQEREELKKKFSEVQTSAERSLEDLREHVRNRETELAALAAERIQHQVDQSSEVIQNLQEQLEQAKNKLKMIENKKNSLNEVIIIDSLGGTSSKQSTLKEVGCIMENELQCSVCAELFIQATTLGCSHTFCAYCINMWKKKKRDCPVCRTPISTECKSLVLDSFIERMVENLSDEMKAKRQEMLQSREEEAERGGADNNCSEPSCDYSDYSDLDSVEEEEEEGWESENFEFDFERDYATTYSSGGFDDASDTDEPDYDQYLNKIQERTIRTSRADLGHTTAGTADASHVAQADIGHLDVPLDNLPIIIM